MEPKENTTEWWLQKFRDEGETEVLAFIEWMGLRHGDLFGIHWDFQVNYGGFNNGPHSQFSMLKGPELLLYVVKRLGAEAYDKEKLPLVALGSETRYATWVARWMLATRV